MLNFFKRKKSFRKKKTEKNPKFQGTDDENITPMPDRKTREKNRAKSKSNKRKDKRKSRKNEAKQDEIPDLEPVVVDDEPVDVVIKHRKKKGKKPKYKKIARPKPENKEGNVKRSSNRFYPGDVDYSYTSYRENWVSFFGQEPDLDYGNTVRILPSQTEAAQSI